MNILSNFLFFLKLLLIEIIYFMADDEPIARRTRSQTAALRAATAEVQARQRAAHQLQETQRSLREGDERASRSFARTSATDVVANFTAAARASIAASRTTRISEQLEDAINRIRNATTNSMAPVAPGRGRGTSRRITAARRLQIVDARRIMDVNVSSLYDLSQDIYAYLNTEHMLYFARNSITENYYFRKLELAYGIPTIDKFNQICQNIIDNIRVTSDTGVDIDSLPYRYDIDYYSQIINFLEQINIQFALVSNKSLIKNTLIDELMSSIDNEKNTVNNLIIHLENVLASIDPSLDGAIRAINETIAKLRRRRDDLNTITRPTVTRHFEDPQFEDIRKYTLVILQAAITLCKIFLLLIIKLYNIHDQEVDAQRREYGKIILNMYDGIANFTYIMSTLSSDYEELRLLLTVQKTLYIEIRDSLLEFSRDRSLEIMINEYNIQQTPQFSIIYNTTPASSRRVLHPLTVELVIEPINIEIILTGRRRSSVLTADIRGAINTYNERNRRVARQLRQDAIQQREQQREQERRDRQAARIAREAAERAARGARSTGSVARPARPAVVSSLTNIEDMFDIVPGVGDSYTRAFIDTADDMFKDPIDTNPPVSLLNNLRDKYVLYSKNFKNISDKQVLFNDFKTRFNTSFNRDEPTPRVGSIHNFVGNSIASLFARYAYNGGDMKFNDLGKYYVVNYTLRKESDDPARPLPQKYTKVQQAGIDAGGLRRDFINALTSELFEKKIFITREGTKKYYLNPFYSPDEEFQYILMTEPVGMDLSDFSSNPLYVKSFYKFLGLLLSFILVNDCGIEHNLSSYILSIFNNTTRNNLDDYDYVYFMLNDFPEFTTSILNLMAAPDTIEYTCIGFNDYYDLLPDDKDLDKTNIEEYLILISRYMMTKTIYRKGIDMPPGITTEDTEALGFKTEHMHKYLGKGIPDVIKTYFTKLTLNSINSYLVTPTMSDEIVNKIIRNFTNSMNKKLRTLQNGAPIKIKIEKLTDLFISRILTNPNPNDKDAFFKFIDKLLKFWSGSSFYKDNEEYKIQINPGLSATHLPQSHTCFFLIDLPDYTTVGNDIQIGDRLYNKIDNAISNVERGMGLAGGSKKPSKKPAKKIKKIKKIKK
jgi:hypothetical protein